MIAFEDPADSRYVLLWKIDRIVALAQSLPVQRIPVAPLLPVLDTREPWYDGDTPAIRDFAIQARRIYEADLSCPIILFAGGEIFDGRHRIAKAWLLGISELPAVRFDPNPEPDLRRTKAEIGMVI